MSVISRDELLSMMGRDEDFVLLNVLDEESFEKQHIPGSENVPVGRESFVRDVEDLSGSKDKLIVVYCADRACDASPAALKKLGAAGFKNVMHYEAGISEWREAGLILTTPEF